ncbi:MAG: class I SAM-dependent methyltransferase [Sphingobacteriaceae bacterium]|nr:class I SAM-dependent methyltransferase [Cytophagaceae bacterium]
MKFSLRPQTFVEWFAKWFGLAPVPLVHTQLYALLSRAVYEALGLGVFESIGHEALFPEEIARRSGLHEQALNPLLRVLESAGYLRHRRGAFSLSRMARKWLLSDSPDSVCDQLLFMREMGHWHDHLPQYLRTGRGLSIHDSLEASDWDLYRRGMASAARLGADELGRKIPLPPSATRLLDIGGSHGLHADWFCQRHPALRADVLDLPQALVGSLPHERVHYLPGDALTYPLARAEYDLVLLSQVSHHFSAEQNQRLARRVASALKPGGYFVVVDLLREIPGAQPEISRSLVSLFFGLTSAATLWSAAEIQAWQRAAGLTILTPKNLFTLPGSVVLAARK